MSAWFDRLLKGMVPELGRLHLAHDPDNLLLDEFTISALAEQGFTVLAFEDEVVFRLEYETRFRGRWDDGLPTEKPAVLMHYAGEELDDLPWDLTQAAVIHRLSLAEIFPDLELSVVRSMPVETLSRLHDRHQALGPGALGANATADFILLNVFRIAEVLIDSDADLLRLLLDLHFRRVELPPVLAARLAKQISNRPALSNWPLQLLLEDRSSFLVFIEERWKIAIDRAIGNAGTVVSESRPPEYLLRIPGPETLPFDHDQVRVILDNMFTEGHLPRYRLAGAIPDVFGWMTIGVKIDDERVTAKQFLCLLYRLREIIPSADARHGDWVKFAWSMADLIKQWHALPLETQEGIEDEMSELLGFVELCVRDMEPGSLWAAGVLTLVFHWGSALRSHPFFASIAEFVGRLLHLHGEFTSAQITRRLKEQYGDRASILRAAEAVLQTLVGWGVIRLEDPKARLFKARKPVAVPSIAASAWLMEAAVASAGKSLRLSDRHLWLFPWALASLSEKALTGTPLIPHQSGDGELWVTCAIN